MISVSEYKATNILEYLKILSSEGDFEIFRGQSKSTWKLVPKIGRYYSVLKYYDDWETYETNLLHNFKRYSIPNLEKVPSNEVEWLVLAQHWGLPTRLLDWTTNPLNALFFSVDGNSDKAGSVVWCFQQTGWFEELNDLSKITSLSTFLPPHTNKRLIAQDGCFTIFPFPKNKSKIKPIDERNSYAKSIHDLIKITIPPTSREKIKIELDRLSINHKNLFPDLDGLSKYIIWRHCTTKT